MLDFKPQNAKGVDSVADAVAKCGHPVIEPKYDGWRLVAYITTEGVRLYTRTGKDYSGRVPAIEAELAKLPVGTVLDGEIVDLEDQDCTAVTNVFGKSVAVASAEEVAKLTYVAFDIVKLAGTDATVNNLAERRHALDRLLEGCGVDTALVRLTSQGAATAEVQDLIVEQGYEGVVVKDLSKPYAAGKRGHGWFKIKATTTVDCVVTGLPLDGKGQYVGQVGRMIVSQIRNGEPVERAKVNAPTVKERREMSDFPERYMGRVVEVKIYGTVQAEGSDVINWRHPTFNRWRQDKLAEDCEYDNG